MFLRKGWRVGAVDRDAGGLATLTGASDRLWTDKVDVTDKAALAAAIAAFCDRNPGGRLDMMWNNAGIGQSGWFEDVPYDLAMKVVDINFRSVLAGGAVERCRI